METTGDTGAVEQTTETPDIESMSASIASDLGFGKKEVDNKAETSETDESVKDIENDEVKTEVGAAHEEAKVETRPPPKSWAKDKHEIWSKMPPEAQEYYETREKQMLDGLEQYKSDSGFGKQIKEVLLPYQAVLQAQGVDAPQAINYLLNAHYQLTNGSQEQRLEAYKRLGESLGFGQKEQVDPTVKALQDKLNNIERTLTDSQQAAYTAHLEKIQKEVSSFASEHPYFDEVADDIAAMINQGNTLEVAYEKAIWANPVTRQKEMSRLQTESEKSLKEKVKSEADKAKKASSPNIRSRDTRKSPTEPKGTMEDTMKETLRSIKERTH